MGARYRELKLGSQFETAATVLLDRASEVKNWLRNCNISNLGFRIHWIAISRVQTCTVMS